MALTRLQPGLRMSEFSSVGQTVCLPVRFRAA